MLPVAGRAPYRISYPEVHGAQGGDSEITIMQEMRYREGNVRAHTLRLSSVRKVKE